MGGPSSDQPQVAADMNNNMLLGSDRSGSSGASGMIDVSSTMISSGATNMTDETPTTANGIGSGSSRTTTEEISTTMYTTEVANPISGTAASSGSGGGGSGMSGRNPTTNFGVANHD